MGYTREGIHTAGNLVVDGTAAITGNAAITGTLTVTGTLSAVAGVTALNGGLIVKKFTITNPTTTETDSTYDLPANAILRDVILDVKTQSSGKTLFIGLKSTETGGSTNCFVNAHSIATAGKTRPGVSLTTGSNETYMSTNTRGESLAVYHVGTDTVGDAGIYVETPYIAAATTAKSVSYKVSADATAVVDVYLIMDTVG